MPGAQLSNPSPPEMHFSFVSQGMVNEAKVKLGERGAPWWKDGRPDYNRKMVADTPYAAWHASLDSQC